MYGVDLHELWRSRQGVRILDLLDGLPRHSRYRAAVLNDPIVAAEIVDEEERKRRSGEDDDETFTWAVDEYSPEVIALQRIEQILDEIALYSERQLAGKKSKRKPRKLPKLRTAIEVERNRRSVERGNSIIARFTPHAT